MIEALAAAGEIIEAVGELAEMASEFVAEAGEVFSEMDLDLPVSFDESEMPSEINNVFEKNESFSADLDEPVSNLLEDDAVNKFGWLENKPYDDLTDEEWDTVFEGKEEYDFSDIDLFQDTERIDGILTKFTNANWAELTLDEQKEAMLELKQYLTEVMGIENPPDIEFYTEEEGSYGYFSPLTNTIGVNEVMLYDNKEAADTIAHELRHTYQRERAANPQTRLDAMYAENFDMYITPRIDFQGYQDQLVESEARAFAQQVKDRIGELS